MKERFSENDRVKAALVKKAIGYDSTEVVEEYVAGDEGEIRLSKKKVTKKNVPPDVAAIKMLMEEGGCDVAQMSDEQLEQEKNRLLDALRRANENKKERKFEKTTHRR